MPRRSPSLLGALFLPLVAMLLLGGVLLIAMPWVVIQRAEQLFGPPSSALSTRQRFVLSISLVFHSADLTQPADLAGAGTIFHIEQGESVPSIVNRLGDAGLVRNPLALRDYLQYTGLDISLQAGEYTLSPAMPPIEIAQVMQSSVSGEVSLHILPGWRVEEIAASLPTTGLAITPEEFLQAVAIHPAGYSFSAELPYETLEGFLFPASYPLPRETTANQLIPQVLMYFEAQLSSDLRTGFTNQGLSLYQAVTLASIVQREAVLEEEMPMIASVFYNRLALGERLASDPTVQYALGFNASQGTWWTNPLSAADLEIDSPYNTYLVTGLPPTPICNPGLSALRSVAFPAQTPYLYFRAACDGSGRHLFAETYADHLANECP